MSERHAHPSEKRYSLQNEGTWSFLHIVQVEGLPQQFFLPRTQSSKKSFSLRLQLLLHDPIKVPLSWKRHH